MTTSAQAARDDWEAGKDWIINDPFNRWNGKPANIDDMKDDNDVWLRYDKLRKKVKAVG